MKLVKNEKMAMVPTAGRERGRAMRKNLPGSLQPSISAASNRVLGRLEMNCRLRNTPKAGAMVVRITPMSVLTRPRELATRKLGISSICLGIISVAMTRVKRMFLPRKRILAKAYPAVTPMMAVRAATERLMIRLFFIHSRMSAFSKTAFMFFSVRFVNGFRSVGIWIRLMFGLKAPTSMT